jgi:hypothetical protein
MYALEAKGEPLAKQSLLFPAHALLSMCLTERTTFIRIAAKFFEEPTLHRFRDAVLIS